VIAPEGTAGVQGHRSTGNRSAAPPKRRNFPSTIAVSEHQRLAASMAPSPLTRQLERVLTSTISGKINEIGRFATPTGPRPAGQRGPPSHHNRAKSPFLNLCVPAATPGTDHSPVARREPESKTTRTYHVRSEPRHPPKVKERLELWVGTSEPPLAPQQAYQRRRRARRTAGNEGRTGGGMWVGMLGVDDPAASG
jgi:hypothetical protein